MSSHIKERIRNLFSLCHYAAEALGISEGEFWVWYGCPFILHLYKKEGNHLHE